MTKSQTRLKFISRVHPKSHIQASLGESIGEFPFFTSSQIQNKFLNQYLFDSEYLIMGTGGIASIHYYNGKFAVSTDCIVLEIDDNYDTKFIYYFLKDNQKLIDDLGFEGSGLKHLQKDFLFNLKVDNIPLVQQKQISIYLDNKIAKIDDIVIKNEQLINLLEEKRVALINHVVTKGLDSNVHLKDSHIDWIGKIPEHWTLVKFRNVLKERTEKNNPIKSKERLSLSIDKGVTLYAEKTTNLDRFKEDFTQYKLAYEGDLVLNSMNMIVGAVGVSKYFGCVSPVYYTYYDETDDNTCTNYCDYLFKTKTIKKFLKSLGRGIMSIDRGDDRINTCRLKVSRDDLRNMYIPYPPLNEQKDIISYLNKECGDIENAINIINKHNTLLEEYKTSLIHQVVTGEIDITNTA